MQRWKRNSLRKKNQFKIELVFRQHFSPHPQSCTFTQCLKMCVLMHMSVNVMHTLTSTSKKRRRTGTRVIVNPVSAGSIVQTGTTGTFVKLFKARKYHLRMRNMQINPRRIQPFISTIQNNIMKEHSPIMAFPKIILSNRENFCKVIEL